METLLSYLEVTKCTVAVLALVVCLQWISEERLPHTAPVQGTGSHAVVLHLFKMRITALDHTMDASESEVARLVWLAEVQTCQSLFLQPSWPLQAWHVEQPAGAVCTGTV